MKVACCIFSYGITKGMKSIGPIGALKRNSKSISLINQQIDYLKQIFKSVDIYIVSGFGSDKIIKELPNKKNIHHIVNDQYENKNYSYALKLAINQIKNQLDNYSGVFFLDSNVIIRSLYNKKMKKSWLVTRKNKISTKTKNKEEYLGANFEQDYLKYLFYNIGDRVWCKSFYLNQSDMNSLINNVNFHDNMFIFEVLNEIIEKTQIKIYSHELQSKKDCVEITGPKDKSKIK